MLKKARNRLAQKRDSKNIFFKILFIGKDLIRKLSFHKTVTEKMRVMSGIMQSSKDYTDLTLCKPIKKYAFVFICQAGKLELGSLFLAASLKRFLKCDYELIAAVPGPAEIMGEPDKITLKIFDKMGVRIEYIHNEIVSMNRRAKQHLITNKMFSLRVPTTADKLIFIDSDFLCHENFHGDLRFSLPFNARPVGLPGTRKFEGIWHKFYDAAEVEMPKIRIRVELNDQVNYIPPCFNSGFIAINSELASKLADYWFECWNIIDKKGLVSHHPYHIGQFSLAVAVIKMNIPFEIIDRSWMYKYFYICHTASEVENNQSATNLIIDLINEYPGIINLIQDKPDWHFLLSHIR